MNRIKILARSFRAECSGIAAVEFALLAPVLLLLCFGGFEFSRNLIYQMKLEKMAFTIADVSSQNESLTNAEIADIFEAANQIFLPANFSSNGKVFISSVYRDQGSAYPVVKWQRSSGSGAHTSQVGSVGLTATLQNGLTINEKDNVIVVEVFYTYTAMFKLSGIAAPTSIFYKTTVFKPRLGALTTNPT